MKEKIIITEEMHLEKEWFKKAANQTFETLPDFMNHIMNDYCHDYGTVCHAIATCAIAAAHAANNTNGACGGITGFQASFVMWDFIKQWQYSSNKTGLKIIDYDDMLYPQNGYKFSKTMSESLWREIQKQAKEELKNRQNVAEIVVKHWQNIVNGKVPFGYAAVEDE